MERAEDFDFDSAWITPDLRKDYGEQRFRAVSFLDGRLYVLVFVDEEDQPVRAISLRKATKRETEEYATS